MHPEVPIYGALRIRAEFVQSARSMDEMGARPGPSRDGSRAAQEVGRCGLLTRHISWTLNSRAGVHMEVVSGSRVGALLDWGSEAARAELVTLAPSALLEGQRA
jgi:hypothetical protein